MGSKKSTDHPVTSRQSHFATLTDPEGCLFGPVLLTGLYCVVAHVVSPRSTHACRTQSPLVARLAGNTLLLRKEISFRSVRLANTKPTAVAAGHSRQ